MSSENNSQTFASASLFLALAALSLLGSSWKSKNEVGDNYYQVRFQSAINENQNLVVHYGSCHCQKVHFKVCAPRILYAIDLPSKIRFPRVSVSYQEFELGSDISVLSMYTVQQSENQNIGIYTFCSFCGMQVLYSPSIDPEEVQVNLECLDSVNIEKVHIAYHSCPETVPHPQNAEFNKRGLGHWTSPQKLLHEVVKDSQDSLNIDPFFKLKSQRDRETYLPNFSTILGLHDAQHLHPPLPSLSRMPSAEEKGMKSLNFSCEPRESPETEVDSMSLTSQDSELFHQSHADRHFHPFPFDEDSDSHFSGIIDHHSRRLQHYMRRDSMQYSSPLSSRRSSAGSPLRPQADGVNFAMYQQVCRYMARHRDSIDSDQARSLSSKPVYSPQRRPVSEEFFPRR
jgi:hypothetical protein